MSDHDSPLPDDQNGAGDPLIARLRSGLDALADRVDDTPPALSDVSAVAAMARPGARRWMLGAAAAAVVAIVVGTVVVTASDGGGKEVGPFDTTRLETLDPATVVAASPTSPTTTAEQRYRAVGTVLEDDNHGPQLCLGPILTSYPPQCGGPDITNWSWDDVPHEPRQPIDPSLEITAKWGEYVVVGTYDDEAESFTLTQRARVAKPRDYRRTPEPDFSTPCNAPPGGWPRATEEELTNAASRIQSANQSDDGSVITDPATGGDAFISRFAGLWIGRDPFVLNVAVAARPDELKTSGVASAIRRSYAGPLCLVPVTRSLAELTSIQTVISERDIAELSTISVDVTTNQVVVELTVPTAELVADLGADFGDAVRVTVQGLVPIDGTGEPSPPATAPPATPPDTVTASAPPGTPATDPPATDPPGTDPPGTEPPATEPPGTEPSVTDPPGTVDPDTPVTSPDPENFTYRFVGTVSADADSGPQLCTVTVTVPESTGGCGGVPITNWTWDGHDPTVEGGVTSGDYVVIGTYDPAANEFTLTIPAETADASDDPAPDPNFASPCDEAEPGSPGFDPAQGDTSSISEIDGYVGWWISDADGYTLNVRFVGDIETVRDQVRDRYDGPLCLVPSEATYDRLGKIRDELVRSRFEGNIVAAGPDEVTGTVTIEIVWPDPELYQHLEREYPGLVRVTDTALELVD